MPFSDPKEAAAYRKQWKRNRAKARAVEAGMTLQQKIAARRKLAADAGLATRKPVKLKP